MLQTFPNETNKGLLYRWSEFSKCINYRHFLIRTEATQKLFGDPTVQHAWLHNIQLLLNREKQGVFLTTPLFLVAKLAVAFEHVELRPK